MRRLRKHGLLALFVVFLLVAAACGDTAEETTTTAEEEAPATTAAEEEAPATTAAEEEAPATTAAEEEEMMDAGDVLILSTQAAPVEEAEAFRNEVLVGFPGSPEFVTSEEAPLIDRIVAEVGGDGSVDVVVALHGTFPTLAAEDAMMDLSDMAAELADLGIPQNFLDLGKLGTDTQYYIPVFQATYMMAANNSALQYLPDGADINALTWDQLLGWATAINEGEGSAKFGFPAAEEGSLLHRFLEGYIYPSFTGGMVTKFNSAEAVEMWEYLRDLWEVTNPQATTYSFMQEQLLSGEVILAWDHQARLKDAFDQAPDDYVAFPAPTGPAGLGFMPVIVGVGIPSNAPNPDGALEMVRFMLQDDTQVAITNAIGFFPATAAQMPADASPSVQAEGDAVATQAASPDALPALLPVGLGERGGEINKIYRDAFTRIVLQGEDIATVLEQEAGNLQALLDDTGAACWPPDPPSDGACQLTS